MPLQSRLNSQLYPPYDIQRISHLSYRGIQVLNLTLILFQSNSVYRKMIQCIRDYINVKLHLKAESALKAASCPTFKHYVIIDEDLVQTNHFLPSILHNTPIAIGVTILELVIFHFITNLSF